MKQTTTDITDATNEWKAKQLAPPLERDKHNTREDHLTQP